MPKLSKVTEPLRKLIEKDTIFMWDRQKEEAFQSINNMISSAPVFKSYDVL